MPLPDRREQGLRLVAEHREQHEVLLGGRDAVGRLPHVLRARRVLLEGRRIRAEKLERASNSRLDRCRRRAIGPGDEQAELVEDSPVAPGREDVEERLRAEDLSDRRRKRRPARLLANADDLHQGVEQAISRRMCTQVRVERCDEPCGEVVLGGAHRDAGRKRRQRLVPDVLVDDV